MSVALKAIQDAVKEDHVLNKKVLEATKAYTKNSTYLTELLTLIKKFYFQGLKSLVESLQSTALTQEEHLASWAKSSTFMAWNLGPRMTAVESSQSKIRSEISSLRKNTSDIKSMMIEIYQSFKGIISINNLLSLKGQQMLGRGENVTQANTEEPHSHTVGEHAAMEEEPTNAVPITTFKLTEIPTPKVIVIDDQPEVQRKLVPESKEVRPDPDAPILMPCEINGNFFQFTDEQIQAHLDKEEKIKKAAEEAKMLEMIKTEVIKVVQEEAEKIELDPKKIISAKACEKFKKAQDAEHQVLKREHSQKVKRAMELRMKRVEQYMWTICQTDSSQSPTDVKIHPNTKSAVLTVYRNNDKRNFEVHNPFKLGDFGITELDELGPIIEKKKSSIIKDLMTSLGKRYERLKKIPEELGIQSALPAPYPWQVASQSSGRKRKHMELELEIKVPGLECNRSLPDGVPFVNNMVIEEPEYVSYLVMASMVKTQENARFGLKLRKLIDEHPDQEKLQSKKSNKGKDNATAHALTRIERQGVLFTLLTVGTSNELMDAVVATWSTSNTLKNLIEGLQQVIRGHYGVHATTKRLTTYFYWKGLLQPLPILNKIWQDISMDLIESLPLSYGKSVLLMVVDKLSKQLTVRQGMQLKLSSKFYGPIQIIEKVGKVAYKLQLPDKAKVHHVFHVSQLKPCHSKSATMGEFPQPNDEGLIAASPWKLLERKLVRLVVFGLIQWSIGTQEDATWEK
ncbi:hypothetical protein Tco_1466287 [Tanacetum coccineum]